MGCNRSVPDPRKSKRSGKKLIKRNCPSVEQKTMSKVRFLSINGLGSGDGYGDGDGHGYGDGDGYGNGKGEGDGSGDGYGC